MISFNRQAVSASHFALRLVPLESGHGQMRRASELERIPGAGVLAVSLRRPAMKDQWNETVRCPVCGKTGRASLSQDNDDTPIIQLVPDGFKVVSTRHGPDFY